MANFNDGLLGSFAAVRKVGISLERLRYWERQGILKPKYVQCKSRRFKRYSQEDIDRALFVRDLVDREKYSLGGAIMKLEITYKEQDTVRQF